MKIDDTLKDLGLEEKEVDIYLALLELGEAAVLAIAQKSGIKRPTAYVILGLLEEKGFVSRVKKGKKTLFTPQHPQKLVTEAELHLKELQGVMPQLEALFHKEEGKPRVMIYEGKDKLDRALDEMFVTKGEVMFMGTLKLSQEAFPRTFQKTLYATFSPQFQIRELVNESEESKAYAKQVEGPYRKVRFMPKELLPFEVDITLFGNRTLITSVKKEFFTISIESDEINHAFRTIFNVMWEVGKE
ncbi:hypothetical protein CL630_01910 [bacterium]|nr:hypothetical protein [bacterium]|tara:strand:+ start:1119 stop:1850 length:732 start_codon:yes stop_codon:yes gene_type:complete